MKGIERLWESVCVCYLTHSDVFQTIISIFCFYSLFAFDYWSMTMYMVWSKGNEGL